MSEAFVVELLAMSKRQLVNRDGEDRLPQSGAIVIDSDFTFPAGPIFGMIDEPIIDTFMIDTETRAIEPLGDDVDRNQHWLEPVSRLSALVLDWLAHRDVSVAEQAYATVSLTPANAVNDEAHFDDGLYDPNAGVGAVAVVGTGAGPRVATTPLHYDRLRPGTLVEVTKEQQQAFCDGSIGRTDIPARQVALFPQFAQLHSGPGPVPTEQVRQLMVYRVATVP